MKIRMISLLLVLALAILLIPAPASAASADEKDIQQQIADTYRAARRGSGKYSFNGYCGSLVSWQTYVLGIDTTRYGCDGKNQFDLYSQMDKTTGGYRVESYPASQYTLKEALNAITKNGTVDAYNILVGFQWTNTSQGGIYGHALLIHGIIDGTVYFMECFSTSLNGQYWAEGSAISCSIDVFCDAYNRWTVFDGIAYFGLKTYADVCEIYPSNMYAMATMPLTVYAEPFDAGVNSAKRLEKNYITGQMVRVSNLLKTPEGNYFYEIDADGETGYVPAEQLTYAESCPSGITLSGLKVPTSLYRGNGFWLRGTVAASSKISQLQGEVYGLSEDGKEALAFSGQIAGSGKSLSLADSALDRNMTFRSLASGKYRIVITATVDRYVLNEGEISNETEQQVAWNSEFLISTSWKKTPVITFDGNGGQVQLNQKTVNTGECLGELPQAEREGYLFAGWSLDPEGQQAATAKTAVEADMTLYAQWEQSPVAKEGWHLTDSGWHYHTEDGVPASGMFSYGGLVFLQNEQGTLLTGWQKDGEYVHYFNDAGAMVVGWQNINVGRPDEAETPVQDAAPDIPEEVGPAVEPLALSLPELGISLFSTVFCSFAVAWILIHRKNKMKRIPLM